MRRARRFTSALPPERRRLRAVAQRVRCSGRPGGGGGACLQAVHLLAHDHPRSCHLPLPAAKEAALTPVLAPYLNRPATTLIVVARITVPNTNESRAWRRAAARIGSDVRLVSETW